MLIVSLKRRYVPAFVAMRFLQRGEIGCTAPPPTSLRVLNAVGYVLLIFVNVASQTGLFGPTNAEISRRFSTPLTPAGCGSKLKLTPRLLLLQEGCSDSGAGGRACVCAD